MSAEQKRWNRVQREISLMLRGATLGGVRLEDLYDAIAQDARDEYVIERVLLHEFIEEGKVMVTYNHETNTTTYYPDLEV